MTHTDNFLYPYYLYAWISDIHDIKWTELEILNRTKWTNTAYGKI